MKKIIILFCILAIASCSVPCNPNPTEAEVTQPEISSSPSVKPTVIPSQSVTIQASSPVLTETVLPTKPGANTGLSDEQADKFFELLQGTKECTLPCFIDIAPNVTKWEDAKGTIKQYGIVGEEAPYQIPKRPLATGYLGSVTVTKDIDLSLAFHIEVEDNLVKRIVADVVFLKNGSMVTDDRHLESFSITDLFRKYGKPDLIYLNPPDTNWGYEVHMFYKSLRLWIGYLGATNRSKEGEYTLCPNIGDGDISEFVIAIASPSDPIDILNEYSHVPFDESPTLEYPIEQITNLSIEEFYQLMTSGGTKCFDYERSK